MTTQEHLDWLLYLMADDPEAWKRHCWRRAQEIAMDPEHAALPEMLKAAMASASGSESTASTGSPQKASGPQPKAKP